MNAFDERWVRSVKQKCLSKLILFGEGSLKRAPYRAHFELFRTAKTADTAVRRFCDLLDRLPKQTRRLWNSAKVCDFNIGVQAAMQPHSYEIALTQETVAAASTLKARIVFTLYARQSYL